MKEFGRCISLFVILSSFVALIFGSCTQLSKSTTSRSIDDIPLNTHRVETVKYNGEEDKVLRLTGHKRWGEYKILTTSIDSIVDGYLHFANGYFIYAVVAFWPEDQPIDSIELLQAKTMSGCCQNRSCSVENFVRYEGRNIRYFSLLQDLKTPAIAGNDSIYLSLNGRHFWTLPVEGKFKKKEIYQPELSHVAEGVPHSLLRAKIEPMKSDRKGSIFFQLGFMSYEYGESYDWNDYFHSPDFKYFLNNEIISEVDLSVANFKSN